MLCAGAEAVVADQSVIRGIAASIECENAPFESVVRDTLCLLPLIILSWLNGHSV